MTFDENLERYKRQHRMFTHHAQLLLQQTRAHQLGIRSLLRDSQVTLEDIRRFNSERRDEAGRGGVTAS